MALPRPARRWLARLVPLLTGLFGLAAFEALYGTEMSAELVGRDYRFFLPQLLDGYYWFHANGFAPLWFTPSFCGGQPAFPDPQHGWFSLPQWLSFAMPPMPAAHLTALVFAALGYFGMYGLLRHGYRTRLGFAAAGALLFELNGFYGTRMLIGHLGFHGVMLLPWAAWCLLAPAGDRRRALVLGIATGLIGAYWLYSGMTVLMPQAALALAGALALAAAWRGLPERLPLRLAAAGCATLALGAAKLAAMANYLSHFPRSDYRLAGTPSIFDGLALLLRALFGSVGQLERTVLPYVRSMQWRIEQHEWVYGISALPALLLVGWLVLWLADRARARRLPDRRRVAACVALAAILALPVALNWLDPAWHAFLKSLPIFRNSFNLFRWWFVDLFVLLAAAFVVARQLRWLRRGQLWLIPAAAALIAAQASADRLPFTDSHRYPPALTTDAWLRVAQGRHAPQVTTVAPAGNDMLTVDGSAVRCYNPVFGYGLEHLPIKSLHPGPAADVENGVFNLKNPACYVWPEANACAVGDHFSERQAAEFSDFAAYRPFRFEMPASQQAANLISVVAAIGLPALALALILTLQRRRMRGRASNRPPANDAGH